jgi:aminoacylase
MSAAAAPADPAGPLWSDEEKLELFCELLRFETISAFGAANGSYDACAAWLLRQLANTGVPLLTCRVLADSLPGKPIVVAEWPGLDPTLPCLLLNAHYDVVPVEEAQWALPAFAGLRRDGRVHGRGTQDMKSVCIQYIIALQMLNHQGFVPTRTIRLSFVPDEEIGGADGMGVLLGTAWFNERSVGLALDEVYYYYYYYYYYHYYYYYCYCYYYNESHIYIMHFF